MHAELDYPLQVALDGLTFVSSDSLPAFRYYVPPGTGEHSPREADSESEANVTVVSSRLLAFYHTPQKDVRCRFGVAGDVPAELVRMPAADPLRPGRLHADLRCAAPRCMREECMGTVELELSFNGIDFTGFTPPLLFLFRNEFPLHVWGCEDGGAAPPGGAAHGACPASIVQRSSDLSGDQHALAARREVLQAELSTATAAQQVTEATLATRRANPGAISWEIEQAEAAVREARTRARRLASAFASTEAQLAAWHATATAARVPTSAPGQVALDPFDKRVYWAEQGALWRARFAPGSAAFPPDEARERLLSLGTLLSLYLHRPTARLYWCQQEADGHGASLRRASLDGSGEEVVGRSLPLQTRVLSAVLGGEGTLTTVYLAVAQPGNVSLLQLLEAKREASDPQPQNRSFHTLLRGVAPTALAAHGRHLYFTVAAARAMRRCALDGRECVTLHSFSGELPLPWAPSPPPDNIAPDAPAVAARHAADAASAAANVSAEAEGAAGAITAAAFAAAKVAAAATAAAEATAAAAAAAAAAVVSSPAGVVVGRTDEGVVWADTGARRVLSSTVDGKAARPLLWLTWLPEAVQLSASGVPVPKPEPSRSQLLALEPLGGPTAGGTVLTLHGLALGEIRRMRYASEGEWLPPHSSGLSQAFLPICDARCPQVADHVVLLRDAWRQIGSGVPLAGSGTCDSTPPQPMAGHVTVEEASWYRFVGSSGHHMLQEPPGDRSCSTDAPGWLSTPLPVAGSAPTPGTVCFKYGSSQCTYRLDVHLCACSFDGGDTVVHTYP